MSSVYPEQMFCVDPIDLMCDTLRRLPQVNRQTLKLNDVTATVHLPHEVVVEILSWLPIKYIFQFRCVSKTWLRLLTSDLQFAKLHCQRSIQSSKLNPNPSLLTYTSDKKDLFLAIDYTACDKAIHLDLPFHAKEGGDHYHISCICNGLLCVHRNHDDQVHIWNPLIRDHITISCSPTPSIRSPGYTAFGFGFVQSRNEYKVMKAFCGIQTEQNIFHAQVSVYTLGADSSWRTVYEDSPYFVTSVWYDMAHVNGVLHWISTKPGPSSYDLILGFDLEDEIFQEIPPPSAITSDDNSCFFKIAEMGGYLCLITRSSADIELEIWRMLEYGVFDSWTKVLIIERPAVSMLIHFDPVGVTLYGDFILKLNSQNLLLCNPKAKTFAMLKQFEFDVSYTYTYMGSLISPSVISRAHFDGKQNLKEKEKVG